MAYRRELRIAFAGTASPNPNSAGAKWADAAWETQRVIAEVDGDSKFLGEDGRERMLAERKRNLALEEAGWKVIHVEWSDFKQPNALVARLARALQIPATGT